MTKIVHHKFIWTLKLSCGICCTAKELIIYDSTTKLWYGNIRPNEDKVITDEEKELVELIAKHHETLSSCLNNNDLVVFEKYADCFT